MKRKICVVTGTRAEYGLLHPLMKRIKDSDEFQLQLVVTGAHLSPEFGNTYKQIELDGFFVDEKIEMLLSSDTSIGIVKSLGLATISYADAFHRLTPDAVMILGDRYEMLAVAQAALIMQIPIVHIHGGECTFGAYDDAIRHSITKMATWHFTSSESHRKRVIQLGEHPERVWNVGAIGIENTLKLSLLCKQQLFEDLKVNTNKEMLLITYHPETNGTSDGIFELLKVLKQYTNFNLVFTKANADNGGRFINEQIEAFVQKQEDSFLFDSLGQLRYLSAVKHAKAVIGNSSSALIEVPYLLTPSVNIGDRQAGREKSNSVIDCEISSQAIQTAIEHALTYNESYEHIFGEGNTSENIYRILSSINKFNIQKGFYDL